MAEQPFYQKFWNSMPNSVKIVFVILILYFFYLANSTAPVPNYNNETKTVLYTAHDYVPKNYVSFSQAILGSILVFILTYLAVITDKEPLLLLTREEATELIKKEFEIMKKQGIFSKNAVLKLDLDSGGAVLRTFMTSFDKTMKPYKWVFGGIVEENGLEEYVRIYVSALKPGFVYGFYKTTEPFSGKDICPRCGQEFNVKLVVPPELRETKLLKRYFEEEKK